MTPILLQLFLYLSLLQTQQACTHAKEFIARRESDERAAKRARNEREMNSFD
jgi:hypothetical protein